MARLFMKVGSVINHPFPIKMSTRGSVGGNFMQPEYESEIHKPWVNLPLLTVERKLENEDAFDGAVKIYTLRTNSEKVNDLIRNKFFGDFIHVSNTGAFFRLFNNKVCWPRTKLVYIDFDIPSLILLRKTNSSWLEWKGIDLGDGKHSIEISPKKKFEFKISEITSLKNNFIKQANLGSSPQYIIFSCAISACDYFVTP